MTDAVRNLVSVIDRLGIQDTDIAEAMKPVREALDDVGGGRNKFGLLEDVARSLSEYTYAAFDDDSDCGTWEEMSPYVKRVYLNSASAVLGKLIHRGVLTEQALELLREKD